MTRISVQFCAVTALALAFACGEDALDTAFEHGQLRVDIQHDAECGMEPENGMESDSRSFTDAMKCALGNMQVGEIVLPYRTEGYAATEEIRIERGITIRGEVPSVLLRGSSAGHLFVIESSNVTINDMTIDMQEAPPQSAAFYLNTDALANGGDYRELTFRNIVVSHAYHAIRDSGVHDQRERDFPGVLEDDDPTNDWLITDHAWKQVVTHLTVENFGAHLNKGTGIQLSDARAYITFRDTWIDNALFSQVCGRPGCTHQDVVDPGDVDEVCGPVVCANIGSPDHAVVVDFPAFYMSWNEGAILENVDVAGGNGIAWDPIQGKYVPGLYIPQATGNGFVIRRSAGIWFRRCMADTVGGKGFLVTDNSLYINLDTVTASLNFDQGIYINNSAFVQGSNVSVRGRQLAGEPQPSAAGIILNRCKNCQFSNVYTFENPEVGLRLIDSQRANITHLNSYDNGWYGLVVADESPDSRHWSRNNLITNAQIWNNEGGHGSHNVFMATNKLETVLSNSIVGGEFIAAVQGNADF